jgi:FecR protein
MFYPRLSLLPFLLLQVIPFFGLPAQAQSRSPVQLRVQRWIELRQFSGAVVYRSSGENQPARVGQRLSNVGDGIITGKDASATLVIDSGIGVIQVSEKTQLTIDRLQIANNGGYVTRLQINGGQIRLKVRPLNNSSSSLQIISPAGITGVRGTDFGISVLPSGKTGVATLSGKVDVEAQKLTVNVPKDFQSLIIQQSPPDPASPLINDPRVTFERIEDTNFGKQVRLSGKTDNVNLLTIGETVIETDRQGRFDLLFPLPSDRQLTLLSTTPLGRKQIYVLQIPKE